MIAQGHRVVGPQQAARPAVHRRPGGRRRVGGGQQQHRRRARPVRRAGDRGHRPTRGQAPQVVEDQVTYPLTTALMGIPHAKAVRGQSMFETSMIYVIFDEGTDLYWARSRVLEFLNFAKNRLPAGVEPKLGPDATGVGWVYQYVLHPGFYSPDHPQGLWHDADVDRWYADPADAPADHRAGLTHVRAFDHAGACPLTGKPLVTSNQDLASLRGLQDWYLRYQFTAVPGVAEVASDRRVREGVPGRPQARATAWRTTSVDPRGHDGDPAVEQRRGRVGRGDGRDRVHGPQPRLPAWAGRSRPRAGRAGHRGHAHVFGGRGHVAGRRGRASRSSASGTARAKPWAAW